MQETGLLQKIKADTVMELKKPGATSDGQKDRFRRGEESLTLTQVAPAMMAAAAGTFLALLAFAFEFITGFKQRARRNVERV